MSKWFSDISKLYSDFPSEFQTFSNDIQKFTCEFQIFPNEIKIVLIVNRAPHRGHPCLNMFVITIKKSLTVCRFRPYTPMLNPVETFWSKMKAVLKQRMWVPQVQPPRVGEQRLAYVQGLIVESMGLITAQDIVNSCQHAQGFFQRALNLEDKGVGAWICILDTCIIIFLGQYSWFRLFCYGYFVIGYLFAFCCIVELICNKMRSSEINLYYSEMQLE